MDVPLAARWRKDWNPEGRETGKGCDFQPGAPLIFEGGVCGFKSQHCNLLFVKGKNQQHCFDSTDLQTFEMKLEKTIPTTRETQKEEQ